MNLNKSTRVRVGIKLRLKSGKSNKIYQKGNNMGTILDTCTPKQAKSECSGTDWNLKSLTHSMGMDTGHGGQ